MRITGSAWLAGAALLGVAALPYLWRDDLSTPFNLVAACGGAVVCIAATASAWLAWKKGSQVAAWGLLLFLVGCVTLLVLIGLALAPLGFALYAIGLARARVVAPRVVMTAAVLATTAYAISWLSVPPLLPIGVALLAPVSLGLAMVRARVA